MRISVVIPCYNEEKYIAEAIYSVLKQTRKPDEIIVVDDFSSDNSVNVVENLMKVFPKIKLVQHPENKGIAKTLNTAIRESTGDVICWLSGDDFWEKNKLEVQEKYYKEFPDSVLYSCWNMVDNKGNITRRIDIKELSQDIFKLQALKFCNVNFSTTLIPRKIFDEIGLFDEDFRYGEDYEWLLRAVLKDVKFTLIKEYLVNYRIHEGQVTKQKWDEIKENDTKIRKKLGLL